MLSCPCWHARIGAGLLIFSLYVLALGGKSLGVDLAAALHGNFSPVVILLAGLALGGVGLLAHGIRAARSHVDDFSFGSFIWSVCVIALGVAALRDKTYMVPPMPADEIVMSKAFWLGWIGNNLVNIWLQLRGVGLRLPSLPSLRGNYRRRSIKITEWSAGHGDYPAMPDFQPWHAPSAIDLGAPLPEVVYVKQGDRFIPVQLGHAAPHVIEHRQ
jgi:hypothetical protein